MKKVFPIAIPVLGALLFGALYTLLEPPMPTASPQPTRSDAASSELNLNRSKMVELYTPYCPACKEMAPLVQGLVGSCRHEGVDVQTVDISREENEHLIDKLNVSAVPTFIFINETGYETARLVGRQSAETLIDHLAEIGGASCHSPS